MCGRNWDALSLAWLLKKMSAILMWLCSFCNTRRWLVLHHSILLPICCIIQKQMWKKYKNTEITDIHIASTEQGLKSHATWGKSYNSEENKEERVFSSKSFQQSSSKWIHLMHLFNIPGSKGWNCVILN